ncbi:hypothetical protein DICSQDRAFT_177022 [Dichomitus squalens LYAD-421 SS1]|uniref:uncharacterized protein n=1 Tax=Dichomitus squalens (strain LYAD-421) TaxID=732165 RepID=UPI000441394D|nr:uncharacterized protein DICSQDRAFT_177022 [Dichomitus squalens LYAD-421 SS1]EJF67398.1 hypothetical protein DICSQDRAFT_177022 [Dichomitus squalens LYAD-421 SS1]
MPDWDTHIRRGHPVLFGTFIFFSIIELAISGWLTHRYNSRHDFLSTSVRNDVAFLVFASVWTLVFSIVYLALFLRAPGFGIATSVLSHLIFLFVTWVFWLSGAAALTAALGGRLDCSHHFVYCGQLNALEAFAWIIWVISTFALVVVFLRAITASRRGDGAKGPLVG